MEKNIHYFEFTVGIEMNIQIHRCIASNHLHRLHFSVRLHFSDRISIFFLLFSPRCRTQCCFRPSYRYLNPKAKLVDDNVNINECECVFVEWKAYASEDAYTHTQLFSFVLPSISIVAHSTRLNCVFIYFVCIWKTNKVQLFFHSFSLSLALSLTHSRSVHFSFTLIGTGWAVAGFSFFSLLCCIAERQWTDSDAIVKNHKRLREQNWLAEKHF